MQNLTSAPAWENLYNKSYPVQSNAPNQTIPTDIPSENPQVKAISLTSLIFIFAVGLVAIFLMKQRERIINREEEANN